MKQCQSYTHDLTNISFSALLLEHLNTGHHGNTRKAPPTQPPAMEINTGFCGEGQGLGGNN